MIIGRLHVLVKSEHTDFSILMGSVEATFAGRKGCLSSAALDPLDCRPGLLLLCPTFANVGVCAFGCSGLGWWWRLGRSRFPICRTRVSRCSMWEHRVIKRARKIADFLLYLQTWAPFAKLMDSVSEKLYLGCEQHGVVCIKVCDRGREGNS